MSEENKVEAPEQKLAATGGEFNSRSRANSSVILPPIEEDLRHDK